MLGRLWRQQPRLLAALLGMAVLGYVVLFVVFSPLLLQDYPNHLARAMIITDLLNQGGHEFSASFHYRFLAVPYIEADLGLVSLIALLGLQLAAAVWPILVLLALPTGLFIYLRAREVSVESLLFMLILSLYLSTDTTFMMGFLGYRLGVGLVFVALALAEPLRERPSLSGGVVFAAVIVLAYLTHLAAIVFIVAALGASGLVRLGMHRSSLSREASLFAPVVAVLIWHFAFASRYLAPQTDPVSFHWRPFTPKLQHLLWDVDRYGSPLSVAMFAMFVMAIVLWVPSGWRRSAFLELRVIEPLVLALMFLAIYFILPASYGGVGFIDVRTLVFPALFAMIGLCNLQQPEVPLRTAKPLAIAVGGLLIALNLAYLERHLHRDYEELAGYRSVVRSIPVHARVLSVYTARSEGVMKPFLHAAEFAVIDRHAFLPYLFSANMGEPMTYFRYRHLPYAPAEDWYTSNVKPNVDWQKVREEYQFLLLQRPFNPARLPLKTHLVAQNAVATLLQIQSDDRPVNSRTQIPLPLP